MKFSAYAILALALLTAVPAAAQNAEPLFQRAGQTQRLINAALPGAEASRYAFNARAGQHISIELRSPDPAVHFKLIDTRGRELFSSLPMGELRVETAMRTAGFYTLIVYRTGNPASAPRTTPYTLRVGALGGAAMPPPPSAPANPMSPAPRAFLFECPNAPSIQATFYSTNPATVDLTRQGRTFRATQAVAASGARYVGANGLQFWNKGGDAQVDWPGERSMTCTTK